MRGRNTVAVYIKRQKQHEDEFATDTFCGMHSHANRDVQRDLLAAFREIVQSILIGVFLGYLVG